MRILHINANYLYTNLHQCMTRTLTKLGVDNQVFVPIHAQGNLVVTPDENVKVSVCYKKQDRFFFYKKQKKIQNALETNVDVSSFDLLHAYTLFTDGNCAYTLSKKYKIPYVVAVRNTDVNLFFSYFPHLRKKGIEILKEASAVFFLSSTYKEQVLNQYVPKSIREIVEKKSYVLPNGIDEFWFENLQTEAREQFHDPVRLIFAGRVDANKNIATTQAAMKVLQDRGYDVRLTVVGKVADKAVFDRIIQNDHTTYIPPKDKAELIQIYRDNDVFVMPSHTESFGLVYAEAMSQGLPVVYTKEQGFDGQFPEGEVGYHVSDTDQEDVADGIEKTMARYQEISRACLKNVEKFRWQTICETYRSVYEQICGVQNDE